jgi:hypothetical protein
MARLAVLSGLFAMATFQVVHTDFIIWNLMEPNPSSTYTTSADEMNCNALGTKTADRPSTPGPTTRMNSVITLEAQ